MYMKLSYHLTINTQSSSSAITLSTQQLIEVSSRLGPSKLRKFPQNYVQFYSKTKTNKKLKQSIQKAEQRLSQNHQDVSIYQTYRNQMFSKKKKVGTVSQQRLSSSQKAEGELLPNLIKHKTQQPLRRGRKKQMKKNQQIFEQQSESQKQKSNLSQKSNEKLVKVGIIDRRYRRTDLLLNNQRRSPFKANQSSPIQQQPTQTNKRRSLRGSKQILQSPVSQKQRYNMRSNQKSKQKIVQQQEQQPESIQKQQSQKSQHQKQQELQQRNVIVKKRRGRKAKVHRIVEQRKQEQKQKQKINSKVMQNQQQVQNNIQSEEEVRRISRQSRRDKIRRNPVNIRNLQVPKNVTKTQQVGTLTQKQAQKIKNSLTNRKQLTKILLQMSITTGNVKQILDLGTSLALQDGPITKNIHLLLNTLKAALLHKYFPENNKHKKKYQKMTKEKKRAKIMHSDEQQNEGEEEADQDAEPQQGNNQDNQQAAASDQENKDSMINQTSKQKSRSRSKKYREEVLKQKQKMQQKTREDQLQMLKDSNNNKQNRSQNRQHKKQLNIIKSTSQQNQQDQKFNEIRAKAIQKLQKMIRRAGLSQNVRQYATKIQNSFQETAISKGDLYRNIAYNRMRNLKTRLTQFSEAKTDSRQVRAYLEQVLQNYQAQGNALNTSQ